MPEMTEIVSQMVSALAVSDPELDTSVGSPTRKIIESVAEVVAEAYVDQHLLNYQYDIDAKVGSDLDDFVRLFGFSRLTARRATGVMTFSRTSVAPFDILIPSGTQVGTQTAPVIVFGTVVPMVLPKGAKEVDVPVMSAEGGESGNVPAAAVTALLSPIEGVTAVSNPEPMTGGTNQEDDDALRARFKRTIFRSLAGTEPMLLGTALEVASADQGTAANAIVIGASKRWREQVQIQGDGSAASSIPATNVKYVYPNSSFLGADIDNGALLTPGVHYSFDATVTPPVVRSLGGALTPGDIYDLDFEYSPAASRNDPLAGITNRVDVWVTGQRAVTATETAYFRQARVFSGTATDPLFIGNFVRQDTNGVQPVAGNRFVALAYGPILSFPATLTINGTTYTKGTHYWVVHDDTANGYAPGSLFGIEFVASAAIPDNAVIALSGNNSYTYNAVPRDVEAAIRQWRLVTTDVRAHQAKVVALRLNLAVMFSPNFSRAAVEAEIARALAAYLATRGFDAVIQASDLLQVAHDVAGVDNVRFLTSYEQGANVTPATGYAIQRMSTEGAVLRTYATPDPAVPGSPARAIDILLADNEVPALSSVRVVARAQNTFGSV